MSMYMPVVPRRFDIDYPAELQKIRVTIVTRSSLDRHHLSHMWQKMKLLQKKCFFGIIWTSYSGRGTCGMYGIDIQRNIFRNLKVPVSLVCFEIEKF